MHLDCEEVLVMIQSFRDLEVWKKAIDLAQVVSAASERFSALRDVRQHRCALIARSGGGFPNRMRIGGPSPSRVSTIGTSNPGCWMLIC
jgi:hypothetical protein